MRTGNNYSGARWAPTQRGRAKGPTMTEQPEAAGPVRYLDVGDIAAEFGVDTNTVHGWRRRYSASRTAEQIAKAPTFPDPDIIVGLGEHGIAGWHPDRVQDIRTWHASRPGPGAGGGRPRKNAA